MAAKRADTPAISALRTSRLTRFFVVPVTLVALFSGCYKWSTIGYVPHSAEHEKLQVRLTYEAQAATGGERVERTVILESPTVVGDSLRTAGFTLPLADITRIEKKKPDMVAGGGLILGLLAIGAIAAGSVDILGACFMTECD